MKIVKKLISKINDLTKIKSNALPKKLSATIRVALDDLAKVEKGSRFVVNMGTWFSRYYPSEPCQVCFAGAVMAKSLGCKASLIPNAINEISPTNFSPAIQKKLHALNRVRSYSVRSAVDTFYGDSSPQAKKFFTTNAELAISNTVAYVDYDADPEWWREGMNKIADHLESIGL